MTAPGGPRRLGVMFDRARPPEELAGFARAAQDLGLDELWVVEDLGWGGSMASAATALAATDRIAVGIGIAPAPLRNPALLAMELATLERLHPGRLVAGIGHGVGSWMTQVGAAVGSPLTLLEETITAVRALLAGDVADQHGRYVTVDSLALVHPPASVPPLLAGVMKPRSLQLSGRVADGTILAEGAGPEMVTAALATIAATRPHQLLVLTHLCVSDHPDAVAAAMAPVRAEFAEVHGMEPAEVYAADGTATVAAQRIADLWSAGVDSVVLRPVGGDPVELLRRVLAALDR